MNTNTAAFKNLVNEMRNSSKFTLAVIAAAKNLYNETGDRTWLATVELASQEAIRLGMFW